ncbi:DNA repair protein [Venturia inaequalis]|nr:DNA repair protein [Venturia inaequalis]
MYNPCLLVSKGEGFGVVGMQTDNTLILCNKTFKDRE